MQLPLGSSRFGDVSGAKTAFPKPASQLQRLTTGTADLWRAAETGSHNCSHLRSARRSPGAMANSRCRGTPRSIIVNRLAKLTLVLPQDGMLPRQGGLDMTDSFLVKSLSNAIRRTYFACFGRATKGSGKSERVDR